MNNRIVVYGTIIFATLTMLFIGLSVILGLDTYTGKKRKKLFVLIIVLVFLHMMQNYCEFWLSRYHQADTWRNVLAVFGYSVRPAILTLYAHMVSPKKKHVGAWCLVGLNFVMYLTSFWTDIVFTIDDNHWRGGPLSFWCMMTSGILLAYLVFLVILKYKKERAQIQEMFFHFFWIVLILAGVAADYFFNKAWQCVDYLTISMVGVTVFSYIWFHQGYVREYQVNFVAEQRMRLMMSQIQPHFIYNALNTIQNMEGNPEETKSAIGDFANYIRGNLAILEGQELITFEKEMELVKNYVSIQQLRFADRINAVYDITDKDFSVPPLSVQILVENAIKHGILVRYEPGVIAVRSYRDKNFHVVTVTDNGVGFDTTKLENTNRVGLRAVKNRVEYFLNGVVSIESEIGKGTVVTIKIPCAPPPILF